MPGIYQTSIALLACLKCRNYTFEMIIR